MISFRQFVLPMFAILMLAYAAEAQSPVSSACAPAGKISYICGLQNVEDLVPVPGDHWILGSALKAGAGGVYVIDVGSHTAKLASISFQTAEAPFAGCTAPDMMLLRTHGLDLRPGINGIHTLYAINHGGRESIEVFRVDARAAEPKLTWIGCLILPSDTSGNSLVSLADGGLAVTKFRDTADNDGLVHILNGQITGKVYIWRPSSGFSELANTRLSGDNGIVASPNGKWLFVADYGRKMLFRVPLDGSNNTTGINLDFRPDNLRWSTDGKINVTGQFFDLAQNKDLHDWGTIKLDPNTMRITPYVSRVTGTAAFDNGTTALQIGNELWIGTFHGDRVAYMPIP